MLAAGPSEAAAMPSTPSDLAAPDRPGAGPLSSGPLSSDPPSSDPSPSDPSPPDPPPPATGLTRLGPARLDMVDALRGLVIALMVLDHVRDYFHWQAFVFNPTDL